jgi:hypothetical protein
MKNLEDDKLAFAHLKKFLGIISFKTATFDNALTFYEEARVCFKQCRAKLGEASCLVGLCFIQRALVKYQMIFIFLGF